MKATKVASITSNEDHVRLAIFDGKLPIDEAGAELLRIERAQHAATRRELADARAEITRLHAKLWRIVSAKDAIRPTT